MESILTDTTLAVFQFLIGRLKSDLFHITPVLTPEFQFLIGRLKSKFGGKYDKMKLSFNSS